jgi:hypothetical protein
MNPQKNPPGWFLFYPGFYQPWLQVSCWGQHITAGDLDVLKLAMPGARYYLPL